MQDSTKRLEALAAFDILDTPPEPEFDDIVRIAQRVCKTPVALVSLVAENRQWFKAKIGFPACETPLSQSVCAFALTSPDVLVIGDLAGDDRTRDNALVVGPPHIRFYAGAPLLTSENIAIGSLCVIDTEPRPEGLSVEQAETLEALARQTMVVMTLRKAMAARDTALQQEQQAHVVSLDRALASEAAGERLREAEALVRGAQEAARVGAFEVDIAANVFFVTAEFCRIFGLSARDHFDGAELEDLILLQDRGTVASSRTSRQDASAPQDVEYRIRRKSDGASRWIARRSAFSWDAQGEPIRMLGVVQDVTERKLIELRASAVVSLGDRLRGARTAHEAEAIAGQLLGETLAGSRAGYAIIDEANGTFTVDSDWTAPGHPSISGSVPTAPFRATLDAQRSGAPLVIANVPSATWLADDLSGYLKLGVMAQINVPVIQDGVLAGVLFVHSAVPRTWGRGEIDFAVAVADRTYAVIAKIKAEEQQRVLNEELSHRLKNTLAMVQAIATQTLRGVAEREVVRSLEDRIIALSKAHDVLLQQSWSAAPVAKVTASVLELHGRQQEFDISGPELMLGPKATLSLSLLLHELTTNSIKYGSLSVPAGRVALTWRVDREGHEPVVELVWIESGGPPARAPTRRGFGTRLIGMGLAGSGHADLDYGAQGLRARFEAPLRTITSS